MRKCFVFSVTVAVLLAGCGSSSSDPTSSISALCDKVMSESPSLTAKFSPCASAGAGWNGPPSSQACQATLAPCNSNDLKILNSMLDCLNALPTCSMATLSDFETKASACQSTGLSSACATAANL